MLWDQLVEDINDTLHADEHHELEKVILILLLLCCVDVWFGRWSITC